MPTTARRKEHFKANVVEALAKRAGQRCSYCGLATSGPHDDPARWVNVGEAAHIKAEAPGGPRHDEGQTPEERNGIANGIWLCNKHHKLVDSDEARFPVEVLLRIRQEHEDRLRREIDGGGCATLFRPIFSIPFRRNPFFTGREDVLAKLAGQLKTSGKAGISQVAAISGLGGIGKTQTAVEFAYRHREEYRAVFFVRAETEAGIVGGFAEISNLLNLPEAKNPDQNAVAQAARRWMETSEGWLLILDNADTPALLGSFMPKDPLGHVLVTSRAKDFGVLHLVPQRLPPPPTEEAVVFLLERTARKDASEAERGAAAELASELGNLPLALEQAAAYLVERQACFADYLASFRRRGIELLDQSSPVAGTGHNPVAVTWSLNFQEVERVSPASAALLRAAAFLAPDAIPDEFFLDGGANISEALGAAVANKDPLAVADLAAPLLRYSLVERDYEARTLSVHRLVQEVVKQGLGDSRAALSNQVLNALRAAFPWPEFKNWSRCERLLPHVLAFQHFAAVDENLAWLLNAAGSYFKFRAQFAKAEPLYLRALAYYEASINRNLPQVARLLNNLGDLYSDLGQPAEAEARLVRALSIRENLTDPIEIGKSLNNLAELYRKRERFEEAESFSRRALAIFKAECGEDHQDTAQIYNNLGIICRHLDRFTEAESLLLMSLAIRERDLGEGHLTVANTINNLAVLYAANGIFDKALPLFRRSLTIFEEAFGEDHPRVADSLSNLAFLCRQLGRDDEAAELEMRAEEVMTRHRAANPGSYAPED